MSRLKVAVVHYHLNRGGVTQVIAAHLRSLDATAAGNERLQVAVFYGGRREGWPQSLPSELRAVEVSLREVVGLDYDEGTQPRAIELAERLRTQLRSIGFEPESTILHVHNHALGKNISLPRALAVLAREGYPLLLQLHDFAEDFRPANYRRLATALAPQNHRELAAQLYPQADHIHYAVLNQRDGAALREAGIDGSRVYVLPNPVSDPGPLPPREEAREKLARHRGVPRRGRFVLYPVRCIRRKNVGEALLWSVLAREETQFGFTLPPVTPAEQASYPAWKSLATARKLPCYFELGTLPALQFTDNLAAADMILTTSVAEGFGLVFLESWLAGRALIGRDLPEITADYIESGLRLPALRPELGVPVAWIGRQTLEDALYADYRSAVADYGISVPSPAEFTNQLAQLVPDDVVDFGMLNVSLQAQAIERASASDVDQQYLLRLNPWITEALSCEGALATETIEANAEVVRRAYSLEECGKRLWALYRGIADSDRSNPLAGPVNGSRLLEFFLQLRRFRPVRTS